MMGIKLKTVVACSAVILCCVAVFWLQSLFQVTIRQPAVDVRELGMEFSNWTGEDLDIDPEVVRFAGAGESVSRVYRRGAEPPVSVYAAVWTNETVVDDLAPHQPEQCYPNAGWSMDDFGSTKLDGDVDVRLIEFSRAGEIIVTAHWYQWGDYTYNKREEARAGLSRLWGQKEWPPLVKVLLQTKAESIEEAKSRLMEVAREVNQVTKQIQ